MARDSSPFAKRLKALAVRAGLPVDDAPPQASAAHPATQPEAEPPADEQPTGEFPAVTADAAAPEPTGPTPVDESPQAGFNPTDSFDAGAAPTESPDTVAGPAQPTPDDSGTGEQPIGDLAPMTEAPAQPPAAPEASGQAQGSPAWMDPLAHDDIPDPTPRESYGWPSEHPTPPIDPLYAPEPVAGAPLPEPAFPPVRPPEPFEPSDESAIEDSPSRPTLSPPVLGKSSDEPRWPAPAPQDESQDAPNAYAEPEPHVPHVYSPEDEDPAPAAAPTDHAPATDETSNETPAYVAAVQSDDAASDDADVSGDDPTPEPSTATALNDAPALPDDEPSAPAPHDDPTPVADDGAEDEQPTTASPAVSAPVASTDDAEADSTSAATGTSAGAGPATEPAASPKADPSLTGRFAALRRRVRPGSSAGATAGSATTAASAESHEVAASAETSTPTEASTPTVAAPATEPAREPQPAAPTPLEPLPLKPTFAERATLRRRVKTLRARRDTGLLELGAIVLDQRRFGDPTAGALVRRRTDELADLDNEIAGIEDVLDSEIPATAVAELGTIRCLSCSALVGPSDRFCAHCGTPRPADGGPASSSTT